MATEKKITSRIQQKHDVAANWAKATNFIPKKGEIIIYDAEYNASGEETQAVRFKIGDGSKTVNNLPFAVIDYSSDIETLEQKVANNSTAIGALQENTVPKTRKINNKALSSDITLGAADVGVTETAFPGLKKTGTVTGVKMNGTTKNPSSGVVDLGTVITAHQSIKSINTNNTAAQDANASEAIAGSGTINFHKVAKTGSYNDLLYKPTIPAAANNGTLTIQKNGTKVQTFTANQSSSVTANITVPTKVSELTNDSGYTTNEGTVTSVSVKMNGASKGTVTSSGTIDLGTVLTAHQDISGKQDKITSSNKLAASLVSGLSAVATSGSYNDLSNKPTIPDVSDKANLNGGNSWVGNQQFNDGSYWFATASDRYLTVEDEGGNAYISMNSSGFDLDADELGNTQFMIAGNPGTSGQVLTSKGAGKTPIWSDVTKHGYTELTNEDLDTIMETGWYYAAANNTCTHHPMGSDPFILIVEKEDANNVKQTCYKAVNSYDAFSTFYVRTVSTNGAYAWLPMTFVHDSHQAFSGTKTFLDGINIENSFRVCNSSGTCSAGTAGQVLTSQGENNTPIWTKPAIKSATLSGTTLTITL